MEQSVSPNLHVGKIHYPQYQSNLQLGSRNLSGNSEFSQSQSGTLYSSHTLPTSTNLNSLKLRPSPRGLTPHNIDTQINNNPGVGVSPGGVPPNSQTSQIQSNNVNVNVNVNSASGQLDNRYWSGKGSGNHQIDNSNQHRISQSVEDYTIQNIKNFENVSPARSGFGVWDVFIILFFIQYLC